MNIWLLAVILIAATLAVLALIFVLIFCGFKRNLKDRLMPAVGFAQGFDKPGRGGRLRCRASATAFEREGNTYRFIVAAHCLQAANDMMEQKVVLQPLDWLITFDHKKGYSARVVAAGYLWEGDDFAVLEAEIPDLEIPLVPLADDDPYCGEQVVNVATPSILVSRAGKVFLEGSVCSEPFEAIVTTVSVAPRQNRWKNAFYCQIPVGPGSSGSLLVSCEREEAVAIVVGSCATAESLEHAAICLPISQFHKFWTANQAGTYPYPVKIE